MEAELSKQDSRSSRRQRTLKTGRVYCFDNSVSLDCTIRDMSAEGARLRLETPYGGPDRMIFQIGFGDLVVGRIESEVRWRKGNEIGVLFLWPEKVDA